MQKLFETWSKPTIAKKGKGQSSSKKLKTQGAKVPKYMLVVRAGKDDQQWKRFCTLVVAELLGTYFCLNYQFASSSAVAWPVIGIRLVFLRVLEDWA